MPRGFYKRTNEHRKLMSKILKGRKITWNEKIRQANSGKNNPMFGKHHSEETRNKIRYALQGRISPTLGKHYSEETRIKISLANKGRRRTEETRRKIRIARLSQIFPVADTKPELKLQNGLKKYNILFETHRSILGQPDIFIEPNICIFVDGCYWHGCFQCYPRGMRLDRANQRLRDNKINATLNQMGYKVFRFWEHDISNDFDKVIGIIKNMPSRI